MTVSRQVSLDEGDARARDLGVMFIETSARAGFNIKVTKIFFYVICFSIGSNLLFNHIYLFVKMQPLFRKIAAALPGMETLSSAKQEDMVDVNLRDIVNTSLPEPQSGGCNC